VLRRPIIYLALIIIIYLILLLPTLERYGIAYDEQTDIDIARSYISQEWGWLNGSLSDINQVRLPMYFIAIIFFLLRTMSLFVARLVSCIMGALTIIAVYIFCKRKYNFKKGLLACFILATNPFFLSFSRIAFTESDIFVTCALSWTLICVSILQEKRTVGWAILTSIILGLALSSKISAIATFPAIFLSLTVFPGDKSHLKNIQSYNKIAITVSFFALLFITIIGGWSIRYLIKSMVYFPWFNLSHYTLVLFCWIAIVIYFFWHRKFVMKPLMLGFFVLTFSFLTFLVIPPVHTTTPEIVMELVKVYFPQMIRMTRARLTFLIPKFSLFHFGCVVFKSSLLMGAWFWLSLFMTIIQSRYRKEVRLPLLMFIFYFLFIIKLPWVQTFYMVPLLPILAIFASDQFFELYAKRRLHAVILAFLAICSLSIDFFLCYPDYNLNGFQWLGARILWGEPTLGYRSIVQTTSDGVEQALRWANNNIRSGETVVTYIQPQHIIQAICPNPEFKIIDGLVDLGQSILMNADYVISDINKELEGFGSSDPTYKYPPDLRLLKSNFTKVFSVKRAFGIEVASVWRKNAVPDRVRLP